MGIRITNIIKHYVLFSVYGYNGLTLINFYIYFLCVALV